MAGVDALMPKLKKHKRKGPKSTRSGCLLCQPHEHQSNDEQRVPERRAALDEKEQSA